MAVQKNFVVKNGIEVNNNLIFGDTGSNKVGIATTNPRHTLHVSGGIGVTNLSVTGISTFNNLTINGRVTAGSSVGAAGQYLVSTGTGVTWGAVPTVRSSDLQTAGVGATTFSTTYSVGLLDVYINGVKLSSDEFTANNGATVVLDDACFGGETIEFISYSPFGIGVGGSSIQGLTILEEGSPVGSALQVTSINFVGAAVTAVGSGIGVTVYVNDSVNPNYWVSTGAGIHTLSNVGVGTTNPRFALEVGAVGASGTTLYVNGDARITGILTVGTSSITLDGATNTINVGSGVTIDGTAGTISATTFVGDGSGLVNVVGSGSGIVVLDDGSTVGTAGTIDFGTNLSVSAISAGVVTVTASGGTLTQWETTDVGINTLSSVGIGTTNPTSALTVVGSGASISQLYVTGVSTFSSSRVDVAEAIYLGTVGGNAPFRISRFGGTNNFESTGGAFNFTGDIVSLGAGVTVTGTTFTNQLNVSGVTTTTGLIVPNIADFNGTDALLYFNNSQKFATVTDGIQVTGLNRISTSGFGSGDADDGGIRITTNSTDQADIYHASAGILNIDNYRSTGGSIAFRATDGSGNTTEQARITSSGVGIGTTNPTSALTVSGNVSVSGIATANSFRARGGSPGALGVNNNGYGFFGSGDNDSGMYSSADGQVEFYSNSSEVFRYNGTGVGIGTTNPTSKLTVRDGDISVGVSTAHGVILTSPNGTQYRLIVADNGTLSTVAV